MTELEAKQAAQIAEFRGALEDLKEWYWHKNPPPAMGKNFDPGKCIMDALDKTPHDFEVVDVWRWDCDKEIISAKKDNIQDDVDAYGGNVQKGHAVFPKEKQ